MAASSKAEELRQRTNRFALLVIRLCRLLPQNSEGWVIGKQLLRSGTSVAANYRAAQRGRSHAEFVAKLGIVVEECDETVFWLELLATAGTLGSHELLPQVTREAKELLAIFAASQKTSRAAGAGSR
jgi:four helix bundle protein